MKTTKEILLQKYAAEPNVAKYTDDDLPELYYTEKLSPAEILNLKKDLQETASVLVETNALISMPLTQQSK